MTDTRSALVANMPRAKVPGRRRPALTGLGHLVVHLAQGGGHLVRERACDDHDVGLPGTGTEHNPKTVLVVTRRGHVHHLDGAACETWAGPTHNRAWAQRW